MVLWSLAVSALAFGYFITTVVRWSGATSWSAGLRAGAIVGVLVWAGFNFGLYSSSNNFSLQGTLADLLSSALCMTLSAGFAAWLLHAKRGTHNAATFSDLASWRFVPQRVGASRQWRRM